MAVVMAGTIVAAIVTLTGNAPLGFGPAVTAILLVTVLFGNFAEAVAEARGRGQAASLRRARQTWWRAARPHRSRGLRKPGTCRRAAPGRPCDRQCR